LKKQVSRFLDFDKSNSNYAEIIDNTDWYSKMNVIDFLRYAGKNITVNYMSAKESVKKRIISGMSFTEFAYQILQAYDFYYLHNKYGINLQIGGDD
jgi:tyrosyl-tRNA synthetase